MGWRTLEAPADVATTLAAMSPVPSGVVLDCATLWLGDRFTQADAVILAEWDALLAMLKAAPWPTVIVGNEIGWSPVPESLRSVVFAIWPDGWDNVQRRRTKRGSWSPGAD